MSEASEAAVSMFTGNFNCAQCVLSASGKSLGLPYETAVQVAQAFGGGVARTGGICGAATGALMAVGLKHSMKDAFDLESREKAYEVSREFMARFVAEHGSLICNELTGYDMNSPESRQQAAEAGVFKTRCRRYVERAVETVEELLG